MNDKRLFVFPVLAVLIAAVVWFLNSGDKPGDTVGEIDRIEEPDLDDSKADQADKPAPAIRAVDSSVDSPKPVEEEEEPESYRRALSGLKGRVVWKEGKEPIAGVEVQAIEVWLDAIAPTVDGLLGLVDGGSRPILMKGKTRTDDEGRFVLPGVHSRAVLLLAIGLRTDKAAIRFVDRGPGPGETVDLGDVELATRGIVSGRVVDHEGNAIAGARIRVADIPRMIMQFGVSHFDAEGLIFIREGPIQMVLPMPNWVRDYDKDLPFGDGKTNENGEFKVTGVRPGSATAIVTKNGKEPMTRMLRVRPEKERSLGTIKLKPGSSLSGKIFDTEGKPIATTRVAAGAKMTMGPLGFLCKPKPVAADGRFEITGLPRSRLWLAYQRGPGAPWEISGPHRAGDEVKLRVPTLASGTIAVQDSQGQPVEKARLTILPGNEVSMVPIMVKPIDNARHVVKDGERRGRWRVKGLAADQYRVLVRAKGFSLGTGLLNLKKDSPKRETTISLLSVPTHRFEVRTHKGEPVAGARIYWNSGRGRGPNAIKDTKNRKLRLSEIPILLGRTSALGNLEVEYVENGASRFFCRHPAYAMASSGKQKTQPSTPIRFVVKAGGHVEGTLTERGGRPEKMHALVAAPRWQLSRQFEGVLMPRFAYSMPDGTFRFKHLDPGKWEIQTIPELSKISSITEVVKMAEAGPVTNRRREIEVDVKAGATARVRMELALGSTEKSATGSIAGSVRIGGKPTEGLWIETWANGRRRATTDASGNFVLDNLADGTHWVSVVRRGQEAILRDRLWSGSIKIDKGKQELLHLDLNVASVRVQVLDPDGVPLSGMMVSLRGKTQQPAGRKGGESRFQAVTENDGIAQFKAIPEGRYSLRNSGGDANWVLPNLPIEAFPASSGKLYKVRALVPMSVRGYVELDTSDLSEEQKAFVAKNKPSYVTVRSGGDNRWSALREKNGRMTFDVRGLAPGEYEFRAWSRVQWRSDKIRIAAGGVSDLRVVMKPDKKTVETMMKREKEKKAKR